MQRQACFLDYSSPQIAAASLLFSIAFRKSKIARKLLEQNQDSKDELNKQIQDLNLQSTRDPHSAADIKMVQDVDCPLHSWEPIIEKLTSIKKHRDIAPVYKLLIS